MARDFAGDPAGAEIVRLGRRVRRVKSKPRRDVPVFFDALALPASARIIFPHAARPRSASSV
jgi:hypothetical protein